MKKQHSWIYQHQGMFASDTVGPISENQLVALAKKGEIHSNTLVASATRTKNQWVEANKFPPLSKLILAATEEKKLAVIDAKKAAAQSNEVAVSAPPVNGVVAGEKVEKPNAQKEKLTEHLNQFMMSGEQIEFICMQTSKMLLKRDAVVSTNLRFIIAKPKMLGRFEFVDCMWIDLHDAHIKEGVLGSTFEISSNSGSFTMDHLTKKDARKLYQIAQDREQAARWQRRNLEMEEKAAGAMQVNIGTPPGPPQPVVESAGDDPMAKLSKLKQMLDADLIEQAEYDTAKSRILESM